MKIRLIVAGILGLTGCVAIAAIEVENESASFTESDFVVADTRGQDRRDDRGDNRDDRQDCRQDDGRVGGDKRDCKQDNRGDGDGNE